MRKLISGLAAVICLALPLHLLAAQESSKGTGLSQADYEVAATVLQAEYPAGSNKPVLVATQTATFDCNPPVDNGFAIGGCSGMRSADTTPEALVERLSSAMPSVTVELSKKMLHEGQVPSTLTHALPVNVPQFLYGKGVTEKPASQPEMAFYMSRPAIATDRGHALIYVGIVSWLDQSKSMGRYFYLEKSGGHWIIKGHVVTWQLGT
ncbi:hypothetical protein [Dyella acidisoli]|uniref:Uncharacterized protein n=1 Tax=Dyella acidisoli TaxID=1867834 RepID=A0ABQ5XP52_9GAMM|nr:hypothetical protein [Dyella acidisoli]GLQ93487.1 hypothetical protein GCM10007901_24380 [Dyella acidisoli]